MSTRISHRTVPQAVLPRVGFPVRDKRLKLESVPGTARIDVNALKDRKAAAFEAHATQQGSATVFFSGAFFDVEILALAAGVPQPAR